VEDEWLQSLFQLTLVRIEGDMAPRRVAEGLSASNRLGDSDLWRKLAEKPPSYVLLKHFQRLFLGYRSGATTPFVFVWVSEVLENEYVSEKAHGSSSVTATIHARRRAISE